MSSGCQGRPDGQTASQIEMLPTGQLATTRVEGEIRSATFRQLPSHIVQVRAPRDALIGDRMKPRQGRSHVNLAPVLSRAPRSHSSAGIRGFPAGCTSKISTDPPAVS